MERYITEVPDKWVALKLPNNNYKIFGTWVGRYLDDNRWRLNSGVSSVDQDDKFYYFTGFSGSCYKCHKKAYGTATIYGLDVLNKIIIEAKGDIEVIDNISDWIDNTNKLK